MTHRSPKLHRDVDVDRAGLELRPPDDERVPDHGFDLAARRRLESQAQGCGTVVALLVVLVLLVAAPRSGQTTIDPPRDLSELRVDASAALIGAPHSPSIPGLGRGRLDAVSVGSGAPQPTGGLGTALLGGLATWYDAGPGYYAAAGPDLRAMLGPGWRHELVEVQGPGRLSVIVELVDSCACGDRGGIPTVIDLSPAAFADLAPLSAGVVSVSIEIGAELPRTDADVRMMLEVRDDGVYR